MSSASFEAVSLRVAARLTPGFAQVANRLLQEFRARERAAEALRDAEALELLVEASSLISSLAIAQMNQIFDLFVAADSRRDDPIQHRNALAIANAAAESMQGNLEALATRLGESSAHRVTRAAELDRSRVRTAGAPYPVELLARIGSQLVGLVGNPPSHGRAGHVIVSMSVGDFDAYLDTEDIRLAERVFASVDGIAVRGGYARPVEQSLVRGSWWRRARAELAEGADPTQLAQIVSRALRALELSQLQARQSKVDQGEADAVSTLIESVEHIPRACLRVGSLLIVKFMDTLGPIVLVRTLSHTEMQVLDRFPEIMTEPGVALAALATAVASAPDDVDRPSIE